MLTSDAARLKHALFIHSITVDGTALGQYLPYYQTGNQHWLTEKQRYHFWKAARGFIHYSEDKFFRRKQDFTTLKKPEDVQEYRTERLLIFYEHLPKYADWKKHNAAVICSTWMREFQYYEAILQYRRLGIALDDMPVWKLANHWSVKMFVEYFAWKRSGYSDYADYYFVKHNKEITERMLDVAQARLKYIERVIRDSSGAYHYKLSGFTSNSVDFNVLNGRYT